MSNEFFSMGEVLMYLKKNNINSLEERAKQVQNFIDKENSDTGYV